MKENWRMPASQLSRRDLMKKGALSAGFFSAAMAAPGPVRSYLLGHAAAQDALPVGGPANVVVWSYRPDIVQDNLNIWASTNGQPAPQFLEIPGVYDYANVIAAKMLGGEKVDMCYCHSDQVNRWAKAGWLRDDFENEAWVAELKPKMHAWGVENMTTTDGKMVGLPYWAGTKYLVYNELHFEKAGITAAPTTWEEFEEQCRQLKAAGIEYPYVPYWRKDFWALGWSLFVESYSEGDYIFDAENNLTVADGDTPFRPMLERWRRMYADGLVPPDVFELPDPMNRYNTGEHTFAMNDDYSHKRENDPALNPAGGHVKNMLNPGKTHETTAISPMYVLGKNSGLDPVVQLDMARFFGYSYTDGLYHVADRWVLEEGLGTINTEVMNKPENRAEFAKWRDVDIYDQQLALAKPRNVQKQLWYPQWELETLNLINEYVIGNGEIGDVLNGTKASYENVKKLYPSF
jgi:multiple sugar transport system substrate-binding protein